MDQGDQNKLTNLNKMTTHIVNFHDNLMDISHFDIARNLSFINEISLTLAKASTKTKWLNVIAWLRIGITFIRAQIGVLPLMCTHIHKSTNWSSTINAYMFIRAQIRSLLRSKKYVYCFFTTPGWIWSNNL